MLFSDLPLSKVLLDAVTAAGYDTPTPIQEKAIAHLVSGRDLVGCARTGTGKTAAFALPLLERLFVAQGPANMTKRAAGHVRPTRVLVLTPTRELAAQVAESFALYARGLDVRVTVIFGGVGQDAQVRALKAGVDVIVATPGRLLDLMQQRLCKIDKVEAFVLDEGDRMLDMGFIHDVRKVVAQLPKERQTVLFSATMPDEVRSLAKTILRDPVHVEASPVSSAAEKVQQSVYHVPSGGKRALLEYLLRDQSITRALVFSRTKHGANRIADQLQKAGITAEAIHGNKSQNARERELEGLKGGDLRVLVATDIAARGLHIEGITHVVNFDMPEVAEQYVHRIGRTARAGATGIAVAFCDSEERGLLAQIERLQGERVPVVALPAELPRTATPEPRDERRSEGGRGGNRGRGGRGRSQGAATPGRGGPPSGVSSGRGQSGPPQASRGGRGGGGGRSGGGGGAGGGGGGAGGGGRRRPTVADVLKFIER